MSTPTFNPPRRHWAHPAAAATFRMLERLVGWCGGLGRQRLLRRDEAFLLSQPDHLLQDIGIDRWEIHGAIRGRWRR